MKLFAIALLALATFAPIAAAHDCSGSGCGPCVKGENHAHADSSGHACSSDLSSINDAGYDGAYHKSPAPMLPLLAVALGMALIAQRRR